MSDEIIITVKVSVDVEGKDLNFNTLVSESIDSSATIGQALEILQERSWFVLERELLHKYNILPNEEGRAVLNVTSVDTPDDFGSFNYTVFLEDHKVTYTASGIRYRGFNPASTTIDVEYRPGLEHKTTLREYSKRLKSNG